MVNVSNWYIPSSIGSVEIEFLIGYKKIPFKNISQFDLNMDAFNISFWWFLDWLGVDDSTHHTGSCPYIQVIELYIYFFFDRYHAFYRYSSIYFPCNFIISCFYQLNNFLANCFHLTEHLRASRTSTPLLIRVIILDRSWHFILLF